jgi:ABC-type dipeptide/oligopeptide/nickel transport system permease component
MDWSNLPAYLTAAITLAFLVYAGLRLGPSFLARRIAGLLFVMLGVTFVTFILGYFAPGDAVVAQLGLHYANVTARHALQHFYGLDLPWYQQYGDYLYRLLHFDLGSSWSDRTLSVWDILRLYVPVSTTLGVTSLIVSVAMGVPLGMLAAVRENSSYDTIIQVVGLTFYAAPIFVVIPFYQLAMVWLANQGLPHLPISGWGTWDTEIIPITFTAVGSFAFFMRFTRSSLVEVLRQDYVRTARAKGLSERVVLWRHAFRNASLPLITVIAPSIGFVVTGLFITEDLFNIPGIGAEGISAIVARDYPVVQGIGILLAVSVAVMNLVADVVYGLADPRIRVS